MNWPAPAKLNLFLHVVGRRPDGYHLLQSVFVLLDHSDMLDFRIRDDGVVTRVTEVDGVPPENDLCVRAARLLQRESGCALGADIRLEKRIPMGGGLGGGSSDAATTLIALNHLWQLGFTRAELQRIGLQLGADVPVFIFGETAFAEGVGEQLQALAIPERWFVVLTPPAHVPTAQIFASQELTRNSASIRMADFSTGFGRNDLEPVVRKQFPVVGEYLDALAKYGKSRMSGSGACVFAEFDTEFEARSVLAALQPGMNGFVARSIPRHPLKDLIPG